MADTKDLTITQGSTFDLGLRWETGPIVYKAITGIAQSAPARLTVPGHGVPNGWRVAITNVKGMTDINAEANAVKDRDYHQATVVDANTLDINDINAAGFKPYVSGGQLQFNTPVGLTGYTARMVFRDKVGGTELSRLTTENGGIAIDATNRTVSISLSASTTDALTWKKAVYDLDMVSASGVVTQLLSGTVQVAKL